MPDRLGEFIAAMRKEKGWTQAELAGKLNVTDKAVSRWERGLGFPDINTIKPLADALEVSVLEIMQSEKEPQEEIPKNKATEAVDNMISLVSISPGNREKKYFYQCHICRIHCVPDFLNGSDALGVIYFCMYAICVFGDRDCTDRS